MPVPPQLARRLERVAQTHRDAEAERNRLIVEATAAGGSLREIATLVGLDHTAVLKIRNRLTPKTAKEPRPARRRSARDEASPPGGAAGNDAADGQR